MTAQWRWFELIRLNLTSWKSSRLFYDAARARDYIDLESKRSPEQPEVATTSIPTKHIAKSRNHAAKPHSDVSGLSERQKAVLEALRTKMDNNKLVAAKKPFSRDSKHTVGSLHR